MGTQVVGYDGTDGARAAQPGQGRDQCIELRAIEGIGRRIERYRDIGFRS